MDIIHKYNADEARNLKNYGELPETARINETAVDIAMEDSNENDDIGIDFDEVSVARGVRGRSKTRRHTVGDTGNLRA